MNMYSVSYNEELKAKIHSTGAIMLLGSIESDSPEEAMESALISLDPGFWDIVGEGDWIKVGHIGDEVTHVFSRRNSDGFIGELTILGRKYRGERIYGNRMRIHSICNGRKGAILCEFNACMPHAPAMDLIVRTIGRKEPSEEPEGHSVLLVRRVLSHGSGESEYSGEELLRVSLQHANGSADIYLDRTAADAMMAACIQYLDHLDGREVDGYRNVE